MKIGDYVIARSNGAGVFAGVLINRKKQEVTLAGARRLWYWDGAASLSQLSQEGVKKPENCKFPCEVPEVILTTIVEILPTTEAARHSIAEVPKWEK